MNSRERVKRAINFEHPDRVPVSHAVLPAAQLKYGEALDEILADYREDFGWDYMENLDPEDYPPLYKKGRQGDEFGVVWECSWWGICGIPVEFPLADLSTYSDYEWPEVFSAGPPKGRLYSGHMEGFDPRWYARGAWISYFEQLHYLVGMDNLMVAIALETPEFFQLMDDLLEFNLGWIDNWTALEYDGLHFADDWGGQTSLMINPKTWRRMFKPRYEAMFDRVHDAGIDVWYHSDGRINDIIPDFIELGVDVINCQIPVMGYDWVAENMKGRIAIRTDIDRQQVLPFGSPSEVKEEVHRVFEVCGGPEGGIIACGEVAPDVPLENVRAMYEAFMEYGTYTAGPAEETTTPSTSTTG
jgi:uroporphyrinogen decarboxylase